MQRIKVILISGIEKALDTVFHTNNIIGAAFLELERAFEKNKWNIKK